MHDFRSFSTERLLLTPTMTSDADLVLALFNTPQWITYIGDRHIHTIHQAIAYIQDKMLPQLYTLGYANYTLTLKKNKQKIGICGLYKRDGLDSEDIGFALLGDYVGQGYAYEAASYLLEIAKDIFHIKKVYAISLPHNQRSISLIKKLGLQYIEDKHFPHDDEILSLYSVTFE